MNSLILELMEKSNRGESVLAENGKMLLWLDDLGIGYLPSNGFEYGAEYWKKYNKMAGTDTNEWLTKARVHLLDSHSTIANFTNMDVCDVGIGNGSFVEEYDCYGSDINKHAIAWLRDEMRLGNPEEFPVLTMWDVLEHIDDPRDILKNCQMLFMSCPVYESLDHVLKSRHYRPNEHIWYWTVPGLITFMRHLGFKYIYYDMRESKLGRDSIGSFVFGRNEI